MNHKLGGWIFLLAALLPSLVLAQAAGEVVDVKQSAQIVSAGATRTITRGSAVANGDLIQTGRDGQVQIVFVDETKIVVGPNSALRIDATLFRANGTARKFATSAVGGTFRFISGKSPKQVYKLATPLATMGIRGTSFDYTVTTGQSTDLLVFNGLVRFCARGEGCIQVPGGCQSVAVLQDGSFTQPLSIEEKRALLVRRFPLLAEQADLQPPFRASAAGCGDVKPISLPGPAGNSGNDSNDGGSDGGDDGGGNPADGGSESSDGGGNPAE